MHFSPDYIMSKNNLALNKYNNNHRSACLESNCSIIENIPPKGVSFSDLIATLAMSVGFDTYFDLQH